MADEIEPLDANRDDLRFARCFARLIAALAPGTKGSEIAAEAESLRRYLPLHYQGVDRTLTPEEAAELKRNSRE